MCVCPWNSHGTCPRPIDMHVNAGFSVPWDIPWVSAPSGPMEQLMVRNMAGPSELQSDAELQTGGQLSVPFSRKAA